MLSSFISVDVIDSLTRSNLAGEGYVIPHSSIVDPLLQGSHRDRNSKQLVTPTGKNRVKEIHTCLALSLLSLLLPNPPHTVVLGCVRQTAEDNHDPCF